ncbi:DUF883 domain-containing protein [Albirhodobacter sp. R86504]|uniref:glycine zipper domain-containing protein n=1 Tax=Albirhodobacter sp. R86504 TaxID=3093848 RepID=UPI0036724D51
MAQSATTTLKDVSKTDTSEIEAQLAALRSDVSGLTKALAAYGQTQGKNLSEAASTQAASVKASGEEAARIAAQKADEAYHLARDKASLAYMQTEDTVRQNPAAAVGIAAGIGFLAGLLTARK